MARKYTKAEGLTGVIRARKVAGEINRAIGESYSLSLKHAKGLISRQNRKERMLAAGYNPTPEGMAAEGSGQQVRKNVDRPMAFAAFGAGSSARPERA